MPRRKPRRDPASRDLSRRDFLKAGAAASLATFWIGKRPGIAHGYPANDKLRIGVIGVANRGGDNLGGVSHEEIAALCDVDANYLGAAAQKFAAAKQYRDFRKMIEAGGLDAVTVSTADHVHAPATAMALRAGLHVYCEKPLTHEVFEARTVAELAKKQKRVTQMGTQIHAQDNYRRVVELVQAGAIGEVKEVHVWVGGGYSGGERPKETPPVPANLDWDLWIGPAPMRPYSDKYVPFWWRGWWDFGTGTLGDMACHHMDLPFWALGLTYPTSVEAEGPPVHPESCPPWLIVKYTMQRKSGGPIPLTWYNGEKRPHHFADGLLPKWGNGTLFVGAKGMLLADYDNRVLLPEADFKDFQPPPKSIPDSIGHHKEWTEACKSGGPTTCNFEYAGRLTEAVLLGCVAFRSGKKLSWDPAAMKTGHPESDALLQREYRKGWVL